VAGVFRDKSHAQNAISELLVSGFSHDQIQLSDETDLEQIRNQHAGSPARPLKEKAWFGDLLHSLTGRDDEQDWMKAYSHTLNQGHVVLTVDADTEERVGRAAEVMNHQDPIDVREYFEPSPRTRHTAEEAADAAIVPDAGERRVRQFGSVNVFTRANDRSNLSS